jgi:ligand-binding sensor domain-containing protein
MYLVPAKKFYLKRNNHRTIRHAILCFSFLLLTCEICLAQEEPHVFQQVVIGNNINTELITGITQDPAGYLWLSSYTGLYRYDGYHDQHFSNNPLDSNSLGANTIECIYADKNGIIWIGTNLKGLDRFDPGKNIFTHYHFDPANKNSLSSEKISAIVEDQEGVLWIGTDKGVNSLDTKAGIIRRFSNDQSDPNSLSFNDVRVIYVDHEDNVWVGTGSPWGPPPYDTLGGLNLYNRRNGKFTRFMHDAKNEHSLIDNRVRAIFEDSRGTFWVGTAGDGLHTMDRKKGIFYRHSYDPLHPDNLSRPPLATIYQSASDHITFITEDATGDIWIGTYGNGINRYNYNTGKIKYYCPDMIAANGLSDKNLWWAFKSHEGALWISSWHYELYEINPFQNNIPYIKTSSPILTIQGDQPGRLWWGGNNGIFCKDSLNSTIEHFTHHTNDSTSISSNFIQIIYSDSLGDTWVGTADSGLDRYHPLTRTFTSYRHREGDIHSIGDDHVNALLRENIKNLWIGTQRGLWIMDTKTGEINPFWTHPRPGNAIGDDWVTCLLKDDNGGIWIGCQLDGGLQFLDEKRHNIKQYLAGKSIKCICKDKVGVIWVGTNFGLYRFNVKSDQFEPFDILQKT